MDAIELRAAAGGQIDSDSHGIADLGVRSGAWSAQLLTDTLELRWAPEGRTGRGWVALRGEGGAAGLLISPWTDGAPDPSRALLASYVGGEGGYVRYLPAGVYAGAQARVAWWLFSAKSDATTVVVPDPRLVAGGDALLGLYRDDLHVWARLGVDAGPGLLAPRVAAQLEWAPRTEVAPLVELRVGVAEGQDQLTLTRLGGLNPYVVPLAGAAWAEFRVEDYAAARVGLSGGSEAFRFAPAVDLARFDGQGAFGLAALTEVQWRKVRGRLDLGWAPTIRRQPGVSRYSALFLVGLDWARVGRGAR